MLRPKAEWVVTDISHKRNGRYVQKVIAAVNSKGATREATAKEWAKEVGLHVTGIYHRINKGVGPEMILFNGDLPRSEWSNLDRLGRGREINDSSRRDGCKKGGVDCIHYSQCLEDMVIHEHDWKKPEGDCYRPEPIRASLKAYNPTIPAAVQAS